MPLGRDYHRQKPHFPTSACSWEKSSALEAASSSPDALGHALGTMRTKANTISARPDYLASYPTSAPHMRKCPGAVELDYGLDHSGHCYRRSDRSTSFSSRNGRSVEHCKEVHLLIILTVLKWQLMPVFLSDASIIINLFSVYPKFIMTSSH